MKSKYENIRGNVWVKKIKRHSWSEWETVTDRNTKPILFVKINGQYNYIF